MWTHEVFRSVFLCSSHDMRTAASAVTTVLATLSTRSRARVNADRQNHFDVITLRPLCMTWSRRFRGGCRCFLSTCSPSPLYFRGAGARGAIPPLVLIPRCAIWSAANGPKANCLAVGFACTRSSATKELLLPARPANGLALSLLHPWSVCALVTICVACWAGASSLPREGSAT